MPLLLYGMLVRARLTPILVAGLLVTAAAVAVPAWGGISLTQERQLGERFSLVARSSMPLVREPRVGLFLGAIGGRILERIEGSGFSYRFFVVADDSLNAFAVPVVSFTLTPA